MTRYRSGRSGWLQWGVIWRVCALVGLALVLPVTAYVLLRDNSGKFEDELKQNGYPATDIVETRVASTGNSSIKAYDARPRINSTCLLHLQMRQGGLVGGGGYSLVAVNGEPVQLDGSPTLAQVRDYLRSQGNTTCG